MLSDFTTQPPGALMERPPRHIRARWRAAPYQAIPTAADDDSGSAGVAVHITRPAFSPAFSR
jgi:hypothetical protein